LHVSSIYPRPNRTDNQHRGGKQIRLDREEAEEVCVDSREVTPPLRRCQARVLHRSGQLSDDRGASEERRHESRIWPPRRHSPSLRARMFIATSIGLRASEPDDMYCGIRVVRAFSTNPLPLYQYIAAYSEGLVRTRRIGRTLRSRSRARRGCAASPWLQSSISKSIPEFIR